MFQVEYFEPTYRAEFAWVKSGLPLATLNEANKRKAAIAWEFQDRGVTTPVRVSRVAE